jgi:hypothetical protein
MSAAANNATTSTRATNTVGGYMPLTAAGMTRRDVTCDDCDKLITECLCVTAPTHCRYCDACGRARQFCICTADPRCGGCMKPEAECDCGQCRKCKRPTEHCVCVCRSCSYVGAACRCYEYADMEPHPDTLCCPHCYSDPCECEKLARQKDRNREAEETCPKCENHYKHCRCGAPEDFGDD